MNISHRVASVFFWLFMSVPLAWLVLLTIELFFKKDTNASRVELSHAKRDATAAEIDAQTLARIKSIQERLDAMDREKIEMAFSQTTLSGIISTRVYFLEQRIDSLERLNTSGEGERQYLPSGE